MGTEIVCGLCKHIAYRDRDIDETTFKCDWCGATLKGNKWVKVCSECKMETDKLYDLFVPHHCKSCSDKLHAKELKENNRCHSCGALRMDCCC